MESFTYDYKPVRILKRTSWEIAFCLAMDIPVRGASKDDLEGSFKGSMPTSLDSIKIWSLCSDERFAKSKHMIPYKTSEKTDSLFSNAVINVVFPSRIDTDTLIWMGDTLISHVERSLNEKKRGRKSSKASVLNKLKFSIDKYDEFVETLNKNRAYHLKLADKGLSVEERDQLKEDRYNTLKDCRDIMKAWIKDRAKAVDGYNGLRGMIYEKGFVCETEDGKKDYTVYKRSANKAKTGSCLFIWKDLYEDVIKWSWLGLDVRDKAFVMDLTSARAYESLVSSSISNTVVIDPDSILLIDAAKSGHVGGNIRIYCADEDKILHFLTPEQYEEKYHKPYENINKIWDGQALVDESIFRRAGYEKTDEYDHRHGMMLLRNHFFKACAFNTKIQSYFKSIGYKEDATVTDMFGNEMKARDVRVIVTPDSIKFLKFASVFFDGKDETEKLKAAYTYWKKHISPKFGIVKEDKASHLGHGKYHEVSYQFLNTLPIQDKEDIESLLAKDREYMDLMKNNGAVLMHRMRYIDSSLRKKYFIYTMFKYFKEFKDTEYFKKYYLKDELEKYNNKLKDGRLKLKGDFYYLCSMPFEMLEYAAGSKDIVPQLNGDEVYIRGLDSGKRVTLIRYPHLSAGSVCSLNNVNNEKYDKWFNFENKDGCNVVVVSPWNSNIMVKLGGADFDSDTALYVKDEVIEKAAKRLMEIKALSPAEDGLPVGVIDDVLKGESADKAPYSPFHMAFLDNQLSKSSQTIGQISNDIQIFNSYLWEEYFKGKKASKEKIKKIYDCIMELSVLNELAIDSAKHKTKINVKTIATAVVRGSAYRNKRIVKGTVIIGSDKKIKGLIKECPYFLYEHIARNGGSLKNYKKREKGADYDNAAKGKKKKQNNEEYWNCPMDLICKSLVKRENKENWKGSSLEDLFDSIVINESKLDKNDYYKLNKARELMLDVTESIKESNREAAEEKDAGEEQEIYLHKLYSLKLNNKVKLRLLKATYEKYESDKDGHTRKDYKYKDMSDKENRSIIWGILFALENEPDSCDVQPTPSYFKKPDYCRQDLITDIDYYGLSLNDMKRYDPVDLWGETWYYDSTLE